MLGILIGVGAGLLVLYIFVSLLCSDDDYSCVKHEPPVEVCPGVFLMSEERRVVRPKRRNR